jgi:hypothetical protein
MLLDFGGHTVPGSRRSLSFGESVHLVVVHKQRDVNIPPDGSQKMIAPFAVTVTITRINNDIQIFIGDFSPCCHRKSPPMQGVVHIALQKIRCFASLADAGYQQQIPWLQTHLCKSLFHGFEDRKIPASRTPFVFHLIIKVF